MILRYIILISIGQIIVYLISELLKLKYVPAIIFISILLGYFYFIPPFFYPEPDPDGVNCGMPILVINFAFWFFGGGAASIIHFGYFMIKKIILLEKQSNTLY